MKKYAILLVVLLGIGDSVFSETSMRLVAEGLYSENLYEAEYNAGVTPEYLTILKSGRMLRIGFPITIRGELVLRNDYSQQTNYLTIGTDVAYFFKPLINNYWLNIVYGPDIHAQYGFCPVTFITVGGKTQRATHSQYYIGSAGIGVPIILECKFNKHWVLRLTESILCLSVDSRYDKGYDDSVSVKAGLETSLSPKLSIVWVF
jgi:hypothetical protein